MMCGLRVPARLDGTRRPGIYHYGPRVQQQPKIDIPYPACFAWPRLACRLWRHPLSPCSANLPVYRALRHTPPQNAVIDCQVFLLSTQPTFRPSNQYRPACGVVSHINVRGNRNGADITSHKL